MKRQRIPRRKKTIELIKMLREQKKKDPKKIWKRLIKYLEMPKRQKKKIKINLDKLNYLSKKFKNKVFIVPGKVLGRGTLEEKPLIIAFEYSKNAENKLKTEHYTLSEFLKNNLIEKIKGKEIMIVRESVKNKRKLKRSKN